MVVWAHSDDFFAKVSFTTVHLLLAMMATMSLSLMKFKYTLSLEASTTIESQMICLSPCNKPFPLNLIFNLSIISYKTSFSFWNWAILSSYVCISYFNLSMLPFSPLIYASFRLNWDISWTSPLVFGPYSVAVCITTTMFSNSIFSYDHFTFSVSSCNALAL